jgi:hypothetical protein
MFRGRGGGGEEEGGRREEGEKNDFLFLYIFPKKNGKVRVRCMNPDALLRKITISIFLGERER